MPRALQTGPTQASLDWLLGPAAKKAYKLPELRAILGLQRDSIVALFEAGELWGHEHQIRGEGINTTRIATRDSILNYLIKSATHDDALREQRMTEALSSISDRAALLRLRSHLTQLLQSI